MSKKYDVTALGELLIDFTESGISEQGTLQRAESLSRETNSWK